MKKLFVLLIVILVFTSSLASLVYADIQNTEYSISVGNLYYNPNAKTLTATAELVEYTGSATAGEAAPTSGTLVIAAYRMGELIAVKLSEYSNLSQFEPYEASLKIDSPNNVTVKAFIIDSADSLMPHTQTKESSNLTELVVYDDIFSDEETVIKAMYNFEEDPRVYADNVDTWSIEKYPNQSENAVEISSDADGNSYLSIRSSTKSTIHPFAAFSCSKLQKLVIEFDLWTPSFSRTNITAYDSNKHSFDLLNSYNTGKMLSNGINVGNLKSDDWVHIALVINNVDKLINIYVDGEHTGIDVPMSAKNLNEVSSVRLCGRISTVETELKYDNIVVYSGNTLYDFSTILSGSIDENVVIFNNNHKSIEEFLKSYNAIHTETGKLYCCSMSKAFANPYYDSEKLMVSLRDAEALVFGTSSSSSNEYVWLDEYAGENNKKVTYTGTGTVLVGKKEAVLSDKMIKRLNAHMTYDRPSSLVLKNDFSAQRPRLALTKDKLDNIIKLYSSGENVYIKSWCDTVIADANKYLKSSLQQFVEPVGAEGRLLSPAKIIKERVQKLALAYHLTGEEKYVTRAWQEIENACNFPNWHQGINQLDSSTMASAIAYGYDWLYSKWTDEQLRIMEEAIFEKQLDQAREAYHGLRPYGWAVTSSNWNGICNGYTAVAACAVYEVDPDKCADIISSAMLNSEAALVEFYPDGAWKEGTSYWNATVESYAEMFTTVKNIFGSYYNFDKTALLDVTAYFAILSAGPTGTNNYNDSGYTKASTTPTVFWFSNVYNNPELTSVRLEQFDKGVASFSVLDLCHYNPDMDANDANMPLDAYFEHLELASLRSSWNNDATYVSFHSGNNLNCGAHSHIDSGTFVLDMLGERFAYDLGSHDYCTTGHGIAPETQPTYTNITRWNYYHHVPEGHNCFIINPDQTIGQNIVTDDIIEEFESSSDGSYAITSLSSAYSGYAKNARRGIMLADNRQSVIVRDEIELNPGDNEIYWFMHKSINNVIEKIDDRTFIMTQNGKKVKVMFLTDADTVSVYEADPVHMVRTPPPEQDEVTNYNKLVIKMTASDSVYLQVKFIPLYNENSDNPIENVCLDKWNSYVLQ